MLEYSIKLVYETRIRAWVATLISLDTTDFEALTWTKHQDVKQFTFGDLNEGKSIFTETDYAMKTIPTSNWSSYQVSIDQAKIASSSPNITPTIHFYHFKTYPWDRKDCIRVILSTLWMESCQLK